MVASVSNHRIEIDSETSRIRAALVNSGLHTFHEAEEKLATSKLSIVLGDDAAGTQAGQAAFLTAVVTAGRCFGQVITHGPTDQPLLLPLPIPARTLAEAAALLGARSVDGPREARTILIGSGLESSVGWSVQAFWNGWIAGVAPGGTPSSVGRSDCALAGVGAGALAVGQAFLELQGDVRAGKTKQSLSLWTPEADDQGVSHPGPYSNEVYLPTKLWLVGLGNLGQAYLWSLAMLPYAQPGNTLLVLQDDDLIQKENWGTSVLVERGMYGALKTRVAEEWATKRGFQVRRIDRRLDKHLVLSQSEPGIALAGLDRMPARRLLGGPGFKFVIDAGLGATSEDYRKFRINVFDSSRGPVEHFKDVEDQTEQVVQQLKRLPAYQELIKTRDDAGCGAAMLAEVSVAVPFVSAFVGALSVTQAIRIASGKAHHTCIKGEVGELRNVRGTLGDTPGRIAVENSSADF